MRFREKLRYRRARQRYARHPFPDNAIQAMLDAPWPDPDQSWHQAQWLALDLETTGLDPARDHIISMGWVAIDQGRVQLSSARHLLIDSANQVGDSAVIHHIRDSDRNDGVSLADGLRTLTRALTGRIALVHHRPMDEAFLRTAFQETFGLDWVHPFADTLALEKHRLLNSNSALPQGSFRLAECRRRYHLPEYQAHNALQDALACAELFLAWAQHYSHQGPSVRQCLRLSH